MTGPGHRSVRARSFGGVAGRYDRYRPAPPAAAVEWVLPAPCPTAVDLGAGTGALTRRLADRAGRVVAVEPDRRMLSVLSGRSPAVGAVQARAEHLPLAGGCADAVVASSSWHWMDPVPTVAEIARVLTGGGVLGVLWNGPDRAVDWVADLLWRPDSQQRDTARRSSPRRVELPSGAPFDAPETHTVRWTTAMTAEEVVGLAGTYSAVITLPDDERAAAMDTVEARVAAFSFHGEGGTVEVPMRCRCWRAVRRP